MYRTGLDQSKIIQRDLTASNFNMEIPCYQLVEKSYQQLDQEQATRIVELEQSANFADKRHAALLRRLRKNEKVKRMYAKVKAARERGHRQGLTRLEIPLHPEDDPKMCTDWKVIVVPSEIVEHLQKRMRQYFGQAQGTPFRINLLASDLGFCGNLPSADAILEGTYEADPQ
jgi:hypothetical protein